MSQDELAERVLMMAVQDLVAWAKQPKEGGVALLWAAPSRDQEVSPLPDWGCMHTASFAITYILHCAIDAPPNKSLSPSFLGRLLQVAARAGLRGMVQALAGRGADLNIKGTWRMASGTAVTLQALQVAAASGHEDVVLCLLSREAIRVDATVRGGRTVLHVAAAGGQDRVVRRLLLNEQVVKDGRDHEGRSALHVAAMGGHDKVVKCLITQGGLDRHAKDHDGSTALHHSVNHGDVRLVKWLLLDAHLDAEAQDGDGRTPFLLAVEKNRESVVRFLLEKVGVCRHAVLPEGKEGALHRAAFFGHGRLLRYLVEDAKLPLDVMDAWGHMPLHLAAYRGHGAIVRYVREAADQDGKTPLHLAAYRGHDAILRYLLGLCGVDKLVSLRDSSNISVLEAVPRPQHPRLAAFLEHALYCSSAVYKLSDVSIDEVGTASLHGPISSPSSSRPLMAPPPTDGLLLCTLTDSSDSHPDNSSSPRVSHKACVELLTLPRAAEERATLLGAFERERLGHANLCHSRVMQYLGHVQGEHVVGTLLERVDASLLGYLRGLSAKRAPSTGSGSVREEEQRRQHDMARALSLASDVAEALEVLHLHGLAQGNLHVGSVMVKGQHALVSKPTAALLSLGSKQQRLGSQTWMDTDLPAPELAALSATLKTRPPSSLDMWGMGLVLCRLGLWGVGGSGGGGDEDWCTAARAGGAQELQAFTQRASDAWEQAGYGGVASVISQCLSRDPKDRPSAREARAALTKAAEHKHASAQAEKKAKAHGYLADGGMGADQAVAAR